MGLKGNDTGEENQGELDLGLSELLSGGAAPAVRNTSDASAGAAPEAVTEIQTTRTALEELAYNEQWAELVHTAEGMLSHDDSTAARVWWVRGHLGALSMPASFLAAPLEALCRKLAGTKLSPELKAALNETGPLLVRRLEDVSENELSVSLRAALERLDILPPGSGEREKRVRRKTNAKMKSLAAQGLTLADDGSVVPIAGEQPEATSRKRDRSDVTVVPISGRLRRRDRVKRGLSGNWVVLGAVLGGCLLFALGAWFVSGAMHFSISTGDAETAGEGFISAAVQAEQTIPVTDVRDKVGSLSALFYSIGANSASAAVDNTASNSTDGTKPEQQPDAAPQKVLERVNTNGPVEGAEFQRGVEDAYAGLGGRPVQPALPSVNDSPSLRHQSPSVDVARPGRVVNSTSVYSGASYGSNVVGRLEPGDRVMIEGNAGRWLRLRSRKGNGGYVRREDVAEDAG